MKLEPTTLSSTRLLRELVLPSLENILGSSHIIIDKHLPCDGEHILAIDAHNHLTLLSCDLHDGGQALLSALAALDTLINNQPWVERLYPTLNDRLSSHQRMRRDDIRIVLIAPKFPPGSEFLGTLLPALGLYSFRALKSNGETALLIEKIIGSEPPPVTLSEAPPPVPAQAMKLPETPAPQVTTVIGNPTGRLLSDDEEAYFNSL